MCHVGMFTRRNECQSKVANSHDLLTTISPQLRADMTRPVLANRSECTETVQHEDRNKPFRIPVVDIVPTVYADKASTDDLKHDLIHCP